MKCFDFKNSLRKEFAISEKIFFYVGAFHHYLWTGSQCCMIFFDWANHEYAKSFMRCINKLYIIRKNIVFWFNFFYVAARISELFYSKWKTRSVTKSSCNYVSNEYGIGFCFSVPIQNVNFLSSVGNCNCTDAVSRYPVDIFLYKQKFKITICKNMIGI